MSIRYNGKLISYAKELRKNATGQERHLWYDFLKDYPIRFQRQKVIGEYIVDFYCSKSNLVIEIDGGQHYDDDAIAYDEVRTDYLEKQGLKVIRFTNYEIDNKFDDVCHMIDATVRKLLPSLPMANPPSLRRKANI